MFHGLYDVDFSSVMPVTDQNTGLRSATSGLLFKVPRCKTVTFQSSYFCRAIKLWNSLPSESRKSSSYSDFKIRVKSLYKQKLTTIISEDTGTWVTSNCYK